MCVASCTSSFEDAKKLVHDVRLHNRRSVSLDNRKNAHVAAFHSAKLNAAQRKYPVHEIEMLAGVETVFRTRSPLKRS